MNTDDMKESLLFLLLSTAILIFLMVLGLVLYI
jgi:hypothetical protein